MLIRTPRAFWRKRDEPYMPSWARRVRWFKVFRVYDGHLLPPIASGRFAGYKFPRAGRAVGPWNAVEGDLVMYAHGWHVTPHPILWARAWCHYGVKYRVYPVEVDLRGAQYQGSPSGDKGLVKACVRRFRIVGPGRKITQ